MDAKKTAQQVLEQVGGAENVTFLTHLSPACGSTSKSMDGVDEAIGQKPIPGVSGCRDNVRRPVSGHHRQRSSCRVR